MPPSAPQGRCAPDLILSTGLGYDGLSGFAHQVEPVGELVQAAQREKLTCTPKIVRFIREGHQDYLAGKSRDRGTLNRASCFPIIRGPNPHTSQSLSCKPTTFAGTFLFG